MLYKVGTRGSKLAVAQTGIVIKKLGEICPGDTFEMVIIKTSGDMDQKTSLDELGSKGVFTDTIERALLDRKIDMAVHSMKDMPDELPAGLIFSKIWGREDPRDVLITKDSKKLKDLGTGAVIATGSRRRTIQLKILRPDLNIEGIRGNIDTRLRKLFEPVSGEPELDGIVLAAAGIKRLGKEELIAQYFEPEEMIPAPGQGALAIELNSENTELLGKINLLVDPVSDLAVKRERDFLKKAGGSCRLAVGAYMEKTADGFHFYTMFENDRALTVFDDSYNVVSRKVL